MGDAKEERPMTARIATFAAGALLASCAMALPIDASTAADQASFADATPLEITLSNYMFAPEPIQLQAGHAYRMTFVNSAHGGHNFTAPAFFEAARVAPEDAGKIAKGRIKLKGGESVTITIVPAAGTYDLACTVLGHSGRGMKGHIIVA
jgi:uncharacterized cupredoxin-like copper-binding protein